MKHFELLKRAAGAVLYIVTRGRIVTPSTAAEMRRRRAAWLDHAADIQQQLDAERARGWGLCYLTGRRVDW